MMEEKVKGNEENNTSNFGFLQTWPLSGQRAGNKTQLGTKTVRQRTQQQMEDIKNLGKVKKHQQ